MMRVGIIHLIHESNTFLQSQTNFSNFQKDHLLLGQEIESAFEGAFHEVGGFFKGLHEAGIEAVPIFSARTTPSGTITADSYNRLMTNLSQELSKAGKLDGLLVAPHGATVSEEFPDADGEWLYRVRNQVGAELPIISTIDLHANLSQRMVDACNAIIAYRTNPHLDQDNRGLEAARLLARTLRQEVHPVQAAAFPPMVINIERQLTSASPCRELYQKASEIHDRPGVLSVSIGLGFPYSDVEEMGSSLLVVTDGDKPRAQAYVRELAKYLWDQREHFVGRLLSIQDALDEAARTKGTVGLLDMGDNVGGGSPADGTLLAHAAHESSMHPSFVALYDPEASEEAVAAGVGKSMKLRMGGKTDTYHGKPLELVVTVKSIHDGAFTETENRHGGLTKVEMGPTAIVESEKGMVVQLTSRRTPPFSEHQLKSCGVNPTDLRLIIIKGVHAPVAAYQPICKRLIRVNTPGVTTANMGELPYQNRRRPLFPFEANTTWRF